MMNNKNDQQTFYSEQIMDVMLKKQTEPSTVGQAAWEVKIERITI
jgi:hypothetical protein